MKNIVLNNAKSISIDDAFDRFINICNIKNLRPYTLIYYKAVWKYFKEFIKDKKLHEINKDVVNDYIIHIKDSKRADMTIRTRMRGLKVILLYFMKEGYINQFNIVDIKLDKPIKDTYTKSELKLLLVKPNINKCNFSYYRTWVLINFLISTGARVSTIINIKVEDLDFENEVIIYNYTKNRKKQIVPMGKNLRQILLEYLTYRKGDKEDYLFCNITGGKMASRTMQGSISNYNKSRGVSKTSCHMFRHTFAKMWVQNGGDMFKLQKILGHHSLEIVRNYVNLYSNDLKLNYNEINPLEKILREDMKGERIMVK